MKTYTLGLTALLLAATASSCRKDGPNGSWVDPRLGEHMQIHLGDDARYSLSHAAPALTVNKGLPIWRGTNAEIAIDSEASIPRMKELMGRYAPVVVTFSPGSLLAQQLAEDTLTLAYNPGAADVTGFALVAVPDNLVLEGLAMAAHAANNHSCGNVQLLNWLPLRSSSELTPPVFDETVRLDNATQLIGIPDSTHIEETIKVLEGMGTRYHESETGLTVPAKVQELMTAAGATKIAGATFAEIDHQVPEAVILTKQKSLVFTIPGTDDNDNTIVVGAHLDSINCREGHSANAPGSDDDASGIATLVEMIRAIADSGATFKRKIEFHAYAAEEVGLVGSGLIAAKYAQDGRKIPAMFQLDMNSWSQNAGTKTIYLVENDTSPTLRRSLKDLLNTYLGGDYIEDRLGGGTSDHRSWSNAGYPAVFPFENPKGYNEALHSLADNLTTINNLPLSARFAQLGLAFLAHHAGLNAGASGYDAAKAAVKTASSPDLKLAIQKSSFSDLEQVISVSTPATVKTVEFCVTGAAGSTGCTVERHHTIVDSHTGAARNFFVDNDSTLAVADDMRLAVFGYDDKDILVAERTVKLKKK
jgi:hypothetical protein